jgi:hypothetical protein
MLEFCTCGSIIIDGQCTNKNCSYKAQSGSVQTKPKSGKKSTPAKKGPKTSKTKRASKCITYNLYETETEEEMQ